MADGGVYERYRLIAIFIPDAGEIDRTPLSATLGTATRHPGLIERSIALTVAATPETRCRHIRGGHDLRTVWLNPR